MRLIPLNALGCEVLDVDVREPLRPSALAELREAFDRHHLLLFRGQQLSGEEQADFVARFGPVAPEGERRYGYVSNVVEGGVVPEGALPYHSDFAFTEWPVLGISLLALVMPAGGAPTYFANAVDALARMAPALRARVEALEIVNVYDFTLPTDRRMRERDLSPGSPRVIRPFVGPHPRTGVHVVNANEMQTDRVLGLDPDDSEGLLADVYAVLYGTTNVYHHDWQPGDLVFWDNIAVHHGRPAFPAAEERTLQRVVMHTKTPYEMVPNLSALAGQQ